MTIRNVVVVVAILIAHTILVVYLSIVHSPTNGEVPALSAGIYHLTKGDFDLFRVNPPLVRSVAAIPVLFYRPATNWSNHRDILASRDEFPIGIEFIHLNQENVFWYFTIARWACIPFTLLGAIVCFLWAKELYGEKCGLIALSLWCFSPTILGHAATIGPDLPAAACGVFACYQFWHWLQSPSWKQSFFAGFALGLAELTKTTWIILFALWPLIFFVWRIRYEKKCPWLQLATMLLAGMFLINLGYGFERFGVPLGDFRFISYALGGKYNDSNQINAGGNLFKNTVLEKMPVPLPANYVAGIDVQKSDFEYRHGCYLNGVWQYGGWWYYYIFAVLIKETLGSIALFFLAVFVAVRSCFKPREDEKSR